MILICQCHFWCTLSLHMYIYIWIHIIISFNLNIYIYRYIHTESIKFPHTFWSMVSQDAGKTRRKAAGAPSVKTPGQVTPETNSQQVDSPDDLWAEDGSQKGNDASSSNPWFFWDNKPWSFNIFSPENHWVFEDVFPSGSSADVASGFNSFVFSFRSLCHFFWGTTWSFGNTSFDLMVLRVKVMSNVMSPSQK